MQQKQMLYAQKLFKHKLPFCVNKFSIIQLSAMYRILFGPQVQSKA